MKRSFSHFKSSLQASQLCQDAILKKILEANKSCEYGNRFNFNNVKTIEDYQRIVPIVNYDDIAPEIEKIKDGETNILCSSTVELFEKTSGTTRASKYIPFTKELLADITRSVSPWIYSTYKKHPKLKHLSIYWSISPRLGEWEITKGGIPVGLESDTDYFSSIERFFLKRLFAVDLEIANLTPEVFKHETAKQLLSEKKLGLISIWSPTFLSLLFSYIQENRTQLLTDLKKDLGKRDYKRLVMALTSPIPDYKLIWPELQLVSCWTDANSKLFLDPIKKALPHVEIQSKGLFMTEGIMSIPFEDISDPVLAINSHFFEFIAQDESNKVLLTHELEVGKQYMPVITTSGGLYRYKTDDLIEVKRMNKGVPSFRFVGRKGCVVDLFGEKLNEDYVINALESVSIKNELSLQNYLLAPVVRDEPYYGLFIELDKNINVDLIEKDVESILCESHHYSLCRKLGQLGPIKIHRVENFLERYESAMIKRGIKSGNIKMKALDGSSDWPSFFLD